MSVSEKLDAVITLLRRALLRNPALSRHLQHVHVVFCAQTKANNANII